MLKFFWNGIKGSDNKLQRAHFSNGALTNHPEGTLTIYAKDYSGFSREICEAFKVENNSDGMTDYFETDFIRVLPSHSLYPFVLAALKLGHARYERMANKAYAA